MYESSDTTKSVLGLHTEANEKKAKEMVNQARKLAHQSLKISEAADIMEEAFNKCQILGKNMSIRSNYGVAEKLCEICFEY